MLVCRRGVSVLDLHASLGYLLMLQQLIVTSICLLVVTDGMSKCSTALLVRRVITSGASPLVLHRIVCTVVVAVVLIWTAISVAVLGSGCSTTCSLGRGVGVGCSVRVRPLQLNAGDGKLTLFRDIVSLLLSRLASSSKLLYSYWPHSSSAICKCPGV